jgi:L-rhamnose mutarotase
MFFPNFKLFKKNCKKTQNYAIRFCKIITFATNLYIMKRFAFKMFLKPGCEEEYARRHAALWPELRQIIKEQGVGNYSIFWDKDTNILFAYQECEGSQTSQDAENADAVTRRWWDYMADLMEVNADNSPVTVPLREVMHLD